MSRTTVKKALADFGEPQLRSLLMELYAKSKEAKELLDFYAEPDMRKLLAAHYEMVDKELTRVKHHQPYPRSLVIRRIVKHFSLFEPSASEMAELQVYICERVIAMGATAWTPSTVYYLAKDRWTETHAYLKKHNLSEDFAPRLHKALSKVKPRLDMRANPMYTELNYLL